MTRSIRSLVIAAVMAAAVLFTLGSAPAATAAEPAHTAIFTPSGIVDAGYLIPDDDVPTEEEVNERTKNYVSSTTFRTLNRWGDSANSFHTKFDGFIGTQLTDMAQRTLMQGSSMAVGNWAMGVTSELTQFTVNLDIINGLGSAIDGIVKAMLNALIGVAGNAGTGVLFGIIALLAIAVAIWRSFRGGVARIAREVGAIVAVVAIVFGVGMTALNHDSDGGGTYNPAPVTPGWLVKGVNDGISNLTALPAKAFVDGVDGSGWGSTLAKSSLGGGLGCSSYTGAMSALFASGSSATTTGSKSQIAIAQVTDSLWDSTGLYVWAMTQAGYNNPYAAKVYCRILDFRNGSMPGSNAYVTYVGASNASYGASPAALRSSIITDAALRAPFAPSSVDNTMASIVAWAACKPTGFANGRFSWAWETGWEGFQGGYESATNPRGFAMTASNADSECQKWWEAKTPTDTTGQAKGGQDIPDIFDVKGDAGWISDRTADSSASVRDFLFAVTGINAWSGTTGVSSYAAGALLTLGAFVFVDVVVIVAKLFLAMFILSLWFVLIGAMFRPSEMKDRLVSTFNRFLGTAVFAGLTTIILTFVVIFTRSLIAMGIDIWGAGSLGSMLWSGFAPVLALILVHIMFVKVFKLPSPISIRGAQSWGKSGMSGALGGAVSAGVGAGVGSYLGTRAGSLTRGLGRAAGNAALNKVSGGRLGAAAGIRSAMAPAAKKPGISEELAQRVNDGEPLTRKEQRAVDKHDAAKATADASRAWDIAADQQKAQSAQDRIDLRAARGEYRAEHGVAAPGDLAGALSVGTAGALGAARARVRGAAAAVSDHLGVTALRSELGSRRDARRATIDARKADEATRTKIRDSIATGAASSVKRATDGAASALSGAEAAARRAQWGLSGSAAGALSASAGLAATATNGGRAAETVAMMGGAGGGAALASAVGGGLGRAERGSGGSRSMASAVIADAGAPGAVTDVIVPQLEATPVIDRADAVVVGAGVAARRIVAGPTARVEVPAGRMLGDVRTLAPQRGVEVGAASVSVTAAQIRQSNAPANLTGGSSPVQRRASAAQAASAVTPAVNRVADVLGAPAAAVHGARQRAWQAQDAAGAKAAQLVSSRAVQSAMNDARLARAAVGASADALSQTSAYKAAERSIQRAARVVEKGAGAAAHGARAFASRKADNAELLSDYRARRAAQAATQEAVDAALVKGESGTPSGAGTNGKDSV